MTLYECEIRHARTAPLRNVFRYRGYLWLVDVDHLPRIPLLTVFRGRALEALRRDLRLVKRG